MTANTSISGFLSALILGLTVAHSSWAQATTASAIEGYWVMPDGSALLDHESYLETCNEE